jgi:hypothetical protein
MQYKLIQHKDKDLKKFNIEINELLEDGWTLHGDYRITTMESSDKTEGYIVNSQLMQKEEDKPTLGFNVK